MRVWCSWAIAKEKMCCPKFRARKKAMDDVQLEWSHVSSLHVQFFYAVHHQLGDLRISLLISWLQQYWDWGLASSPSIITCAYLNLLLLANLRFQRTFSGHVFHQLSIAQLQKCAQAQRCSAPKCDRTCRLSVDNLGLKWIFQRL